MITNKLSKPFLAIVVAALALVTVSFVVVTPRASEPYLDYALRHPGEVIVPVTGNLDTAGSDYFQRHPEQTALSLIGQGASDYFQRHPELIVSSDADRDTTDYYFRHLELQGVSIQNGDLTDYFFRHLSD